MEDQRPRHRRRKPGHVEPGLRLTGSHELPLAIDEDLHPGVVVVGVGPARRIDLPGGNARGAQRGHGQRGLLAAAPHAALNRLQRRRRTAVGRLVSSHLVTPVVDLQGRLLQRHARHTGAERIGIQRPEIVERFIVHPQRQHEVPELPFGNVPAHPLAHFERLFDICLPISQRLRRKVGMRHIGIQEIHIGVRLAPRLAAAGCQYQRQQ